MSWTRHLAPATLITWSPPTDTEPGPRHCLQVQLRLGSTQISRHMVTPPCHNPLLSMPSPLSPKKIKIPFLAILTHCTMFYNQITFTYSRGIIICNSIHTYIDDLARGLLPLIADDVIKDRPLDFSASHSTAQLTAYSCRRCCKKSPQVPFKTYLYFVSFVVLENMDGICTQIQHVHCMSITNKARLLWNLLHINC